jgi:hypothetical protein
VRYKLVSVNSGYDPVTGSCGRGNEISGSIKDGEIFDQMSDF